MGNGFERLCDVRRDVKKTYDQLKRKTEAKLEDDLNHSSFMLSIIKFTIRHEEEFTEFLLEEKRRSTNL